MSDLPERISVREVGPRDGLQRREVIDDPAVVTAYLGHSFKRAGRPGDAETPP